MVRQLEAVFEAGVLRPLQPLQLPEHHRVIVTIDDNLAANTAEFDHRYAEQAWLGEHGHAHIGEWVALDGGKLVAHGLNAVRVRDEARSQGVERPFVVRVPANLGEPSAGWL
jgi:predicted DNA-binding antitoxin AbrB/MazE fold protein